MGVGVCVCVGWGGGVLYMTPLEQKFRGGYGGLIGRTIRGGGGYGYFLESHNIKWFWHLKKKKVNTNSVTKIR